MKIRNFDTLRFLILVSLGISFYFLRRDPFHPSMDSKAVSLKEIITDGMRQDGS